ncbi:TPA: hypothetical protein RZC51_002659 [Burkholderia cenocepacia]|nr:hypothetical protein [Burkholderia cenocepacia]
MHPSNRRIVTGHNAAGKAVIVIVIVSDGAAPAEFPIQSLPGLVFSEVWRSNESPAHCS